MNPEHPIDALVRNHLEREAAAVDARAVLARVRAKLTAPRNRLRRVLRVGAGLLTATAAVVAVVVLWGNAPQAAQATAAELVQAAQQVHAAAVDRCYDIRTEWDPAFPRRGPFQSLARESRVWTRGDRFWLESTTDGKPWAWGRDGGGRVWVAFNRQTGLLFEADEVGIPMAEACDLFSMKLASTLGELLTDYDLGRESDGPGSPVRVTAVLRGGPANPRPQALTVEIDPRTKEVRRLRIRRPAVTVTFTLTATDALPEDRYDLAGHLDAGATAFDTNRKVGRLLLWQRFLGPRFGDLERAMKGGPISEPGPKK
jgi:hypothetical protein